ncbi:agmatine deaminase AguA [Gottschalkia acidurici 9a]|uniref:Agmatine deaminase AguA n=1 Tax=Gottschalkia acidurici (strain ATCC 7906 / DSM 604 / BCRC 14475 / CIP 104303 / KCTC 5404 / NCIMB 10678 / 9a) TaxID=1128398 RepID=K0AUL8_GOTA9|nr:agmatine deiminase family protein [Gottschalkia acidurici]AFS77578.1 agmatine deaminase AguA [Gottschalkia acidurici 9a]
MKKQYSMIALASVCVVVVLLAGACNYTQGSRNKKDIKNNLNDKDYSQYSKLELNVEEKPTTYRFPAEFEKQQAIWMQWPPEVYDQDEAHPVSPIIINIMKAFESYIKVNVMVRDNDDINKIESMLKNSGYSGTNIHFHEISHSSIWTRDVGPIFIKDSENKLNVVDFGFNNYSRGGSEDYIRIESQIDKSVAELYKLPVVDTKLISEGGAIESNGQGTLMTTESVVLKRNPEMTKQQIEDEYKRVLGVKKIIWLKKGLAEDDHITSGHINEIARFTDQNTILLAQILPEDRYVNEASSESYLRLEENYNILKNATDQDGKSFNIIRVPMPSTIYQRPNSEGKIPIRSYLNYAVTNGSVVMQTYWKPGLSSELKQTEDRVKEILRDVFPGRDIIGIDSDDLNLWGGGIHCITQHMPAD